MDAFKVMDIVSFVITIVTSIPVAIAAVKAIQYFQKKKAWFAEISSGKDKTDAIIMVNIKTNANDQVDLPSQVEMYWKQQTKFPQITDQELKLPLQREPINDHAPDEDIKKILEEFQQIYGKALRKGAQRIHFFYRGPTQVAAMLGALMSNGCPVICHQFHIEYFDYGLLKRSI